MNVSIIPCADGAALSSAAAAWIARDPAGMALVAGVAGIPGAWSNVIAVDGMPVVAIAHTPPHLVLLAAAVDPDLATVAAVAGVQAPRTSPGLSAPPAWAEAVAAALGRRVSARERHRLHRLSGPPRLPRPCAGTARWAAPVDIELLRQWRDGFTRDAVPRESLSPTSAEQVRGMLGDTLLWTVDRRPVAMAVRKRPLLGGWSIAGVYTPPEHRRHGYAGAVVHALASRLVADGATYVVLYTDLANPTSNRLYADIGFVPVADNDILFWEPT